MKGLLERAGFRVFNPTLPCHWPNRERNVGCKLFGRVITAQMYVDSYLQVRARGGTPLLCVHGMPGHCAPRVQVRREPIHQEAQKGCGHSGLVGSSTREA